MWVCFFAIFFLRTGSCNSLLLCVGLFEECFLEDRIRLGRECAAAFGVKGKLAAIEATRDGEMYMNINSTGVSLGLANPTVASKDVGSTPGLCLCLEQGTSP